MLSPFIAPPESLFIIVFLGSKSYHVAGLMVNGGYTCWSSLGQQEGRIASIEDVLSSGMLTDLDVMQASLNRGSGSGHVYRARLASQPFEWFAKVGMGNRGKG
jgi:hypothetical protein